MPQIKVECVTVGEIGENCYIVENAASGECFIVDPGDEGQRIIRSVGGRRPAGVVLTHGHYDHIAAVDEICNHYQIPLYIHPADLPKLTDTNANVSGLFGRPVTIETQPKFVDEGDSLTLAGIELKVLHTPGHSMGSVCYLLPENQGLITGDTLFAHGYGRTDFADGDFQQMCASLRRLFRLTPRMITYPGHDQTGTVGRDAGEDA